MAWRPELIHSVAGAADSAWEEDEEASHGPTHVLAEGPRRVAFLEAERQEKKSTEVSEHEDKTHVGALTRSKAKGSRGLSNLSGEDGKQATDTSDMKRKVGRESATVGPTVGSRKKAPKQVGAPWMQASAESIAEDPEPYVTCNLLHATDQESLPESQATMSSAGPSTPDQVARLQLTLCSSSSQASLSEGELGHLSGASPESPAKHLLADLPPALLLEILSHLKAHDLSVVACVSRLFHGLAGESQGWKSFYCERWRPAKGLHGPPTEGAGLHVAPHGRSWKDLYVEREMRSSSLLGAFQADLLHGHTAPARCVKILPGSNLVASGGYDHSVRLWDLDAGMPLAATAPLDVIVRSVAVDHDSLAVGTSDGAIRVWHASAACPHLFDLTGAGTLGQAVTAGSSPDRWWGHGGPVSCLAVEEKRLYSGSWDMTAKVWSTDAASDAMLRSFNHRDWVWALAIRSGKLLTTAGADLYRWDVETGQLLTLRARAHLSQALAVQGTQLGHFTFTAGQDGMVRLFDERLARRKGPALGAEEAVVAWRPHASAINAMAFEDPWLVTASSDSQLGMLDMRSALHGHRRGPSKHTSGHYARVRNDSPEIGAFSRKLGAFQQAALCVDIDGVRIVAGGEGPAHVLKVWDFSQALEIERRVQASRGTRNRQRQKKRQENREGLQGATSGSSSTSGAAKQDSGSARREMGARSDLHARSPFNRPHTPHYEAIPHGGKIGTDRSTEKGARGKLSLAKVGGKGSLNEVWKVKGRAR